MGTAAVTLYATAVNSSISNGTYVGTATQLATTTANSLGGWGFNSSSYTCPANQIVYIAAYGGNAGAGTNNNILVTAVLGQCGSLNSFTDVNELTSIATAYAFSSFMSINTSGSAPVVNITAPANNASFAATNDTSTTTATATTASGLLHAYNNAINLVNMQSGTSYTVPPSNSGGIAPGVLLNTLGNVLQACVNSTGGVASSPTTTCGKLFAYSPSLAGVSPTNTLQAALNIARNPYISSTNVTNLFNLAAPSVAFAPILTTAPKDWTLAISYPVPPNPVSGLGFPFTVALDADDSVYITSPENDIYVPNTSYTTTATSGSACLFGFASNGRLLPTITPYSGTPGSGTPGTSSWYCASGSSNTNPTLLTQLAPDALGNVYIANLTQSGNAAMTSENVLLKVNTSSPSSATVYTLPTPSGLSTSYAPRAVVVNEVNDAVFSINYGTSSAQTQFCVTANGAAGPGSCTVVLGSGSGDLAQAANWFALDSVQTLWAAQYSDTTLASGAFPNYGGGFGGMANLGTLSAPSYNGSWTKKPMDGGNVVTTGGLQENSAPYGLALDSSNTPWLTLDAPQNGGTNTDPVGLVKASVSGGLPATTLPAATITTLGLVAPKWIESDGNNVMWIADTGGIVAYATTASPAVAEVSQSGGFSPCITNSATCSYPDFSSTKGIAVDSTGSVWFTTPDATTSVANSNRLIQLIGTASSAWPLLATGKPGVMPQ